MTLTTTFTLYYDPILDINKSKSCSQCHLQSKSFSSAGSVLPHVNLVFYNKYLWNGSLEGRLEDAMMFEVEDFMQTNLNNLNDDAIYSKLFEEAFGVQVISSKEVAYALAQFVCTLISSNSKYDKVLNNQAGIYLDDNPPPLGSELNGYDIFYTEKGDCFHCHGTILFTDNDFHNNGLDTLPGLGRYEVTGLIKDIGKYKTPTLRNIAYTAPYMHDGRFATLAEVVDFYSTGLKYSNTVDPLMRVHQGGINLTSQEKLDLIAFLHTLSDTSFINNKAFQ